jgi:hypothetical protein
MKTRPATGPNSNQARSTLRVANAHCCVPEVLCSDTILKGADQAADALAGLDPTELWRN